jgi:plasmid stability protein
MSTITVRNLPNDLVDRIKAAAEKKGRSMEQEVRELLMHRYMPKDDLLQRIRERWKNVDTPTAAEIENWTQTGRP